MATTRRNFIGWLGAGGTSALLGGCERAAEELAAFAGLAEEGVFRPPASDEVDDVTHVLNRITWGPRPGEHARVAAMGIDAFLAEQLEPEAIRDRWCDWRVASIESMAEPAAEAYERNERELLLDMSRYKLLRATYSRRQLHEVMVDFWTDHLNIVSEKGDCRWLKLADDRDVVRRHALGRFRDLVRASATSAAMLIYLDGHDNKVETPGDRPNENYARELLELHTLGADGGYTQRDVMEVARCLSGWTYENRPFRGRGARVAFVPGRHDHDAKFVLGRRIPAGGGADDLERVLDVVCAHPSTARHVARRLCRRFVDDPAPDAAVEATARAFRSTDGDIRATLSALFATDDFRRRRGTLFKRPFRFVVSALRGTDARTNAAPALLEHLERMGHAPFQYPTPDGYPIEAAPWHGSLLWRWNLAISLADGAVPGTSLDTAALADRAGGAAGLAAHLLGRRPSALERGALDGSDRAVAILLASPAFQRH